MQSPLMHIAGAEHAAPLTQLPLSSQVCGVPCSHLLAPGRHAVQVVPMHTAGAQLVSPPQLPVGSQTCCVVPLRHRFAPGAQAAQTFPMHAPEAQLELFAQLPEASQVCWVVVSRHLVSVGRHTVHVLPRQTPGVQALSLVQRPSAPHDCCVTPSRQRVSPGVHSAQALFMQMGGLQTSLSTQRPPAWHVWTLLLVHRLSPGLHSPSQLPPAQTNRHMVSPPQLPFVSQTCAVPSAAGLQRRDPGSQVPTHVLLPTEHTNGHALPSFVQLPVASHTWGCLPVHRRAPGTHVEHAPAIQAAAHVMSAPQLPLGSQVCSVVASRHCRIPGEHTVQAPPRHTVSQVSASCQLPCAVHVWSVLLSPGLHCVAFGAHCVQAPPTHAVAVQAGPLFTKRPLASHTMGWLPAQALAPGLQSEQTPSIEHTVHCAASCQLPLLSHTCDMVPLQRRAPGRHAPVHLPPEQT
jgi:hypothetical protein